MKNEYYKAKLTAGEYEELLEVANWYSDKHKPQYRPLPDETIDNLIYEYNSDASPRITDGEYRNEISMYMSVDSKPYTWEVNAELIEKAIGWVEKEMM